jgi:glycosyltransferase involved in cell wall biosynthesis
MNRLLNVNSYHYRRGGSDVVYFEHAALLEANGWETAYFSMNHPKNLPSTWQPYFVDELEFGSDYGLFEKVLMASKAVYSFEAQRKLRALLDRFPADVAHLHCIYHHLSPSILPVLKARGVKTVMTAHDLKIACPAYKMLNASGICERCNGGSVLNVVKHRCVRDSLAASAIVAVESALQRGMRTYLNHLDKVVAPSRFFIEKFVEWGWPRDRFAYIPNYVDTAKFEPGPAGGTYFLYFGRLAVEKGVETLLRAVARSGVSLKLAGTGPEENKLKALAAELGVDAEFVGFKSGAALHDLIRQARAVVLPSEWYENAPMSILESAAMQVPVIGADIGGIPEMIVPGETGWVFPSRDVNALAQLLKEVDGMTAARLESVGCSARELVEARFNQAGYLEATQKLYAELGVKA